MKRTLQKFLPPKMTTHEHDAPKIYSFELTRSHKTKFNEHVAEHLQSSHPK